MAVAGIVNFHCRSPSLKSEEGSNFGPVGATEGQNCLPEVTITTSTIGHAKLPGLLEYCWGYRCVRIAQRSEQHDKCVGCLHVEAFFLPNYISTPSVRPDTLS